MTKPKHERQQWLDIAIVELQKEFKKEGLKLPKYRATIGLPSKGGFSAKNRTIGQCYYPAASKDKTTEIMVSPTQDKPLDILAIAAHEVCHGVLGAGFGHGKEFRKLALSIGLTGKMTATEPGPEFIRRTKHILENLGAFAHKRLDITVGQKKQSTRMLKCECLNDGCGMVFRTSSKWVEVAGDDMSCPICTALVKIG
jgi:hypothetical protein